MRKEKPRIKEEEHNEQTENQKGYSRRFFKVSKGKWKGNFFVGGGGGVKGAQLMENGRKRDENVSLRH